MRAAVYTHRDVRKLLSQLSEGKIHKADSIPVYAIERAFIEDVAAALERRSELSISIKDRELYLVLADRNFITTIVEHRIE